MIGWTAKAAAMLLWVMTAAASPAWAIAPAAPVAMEIETPALSATLHYPAGSSGKLPAVLVFGGSEGGRIWASNMARSLAAQGYVALGVTYFGGPGEGLTDQLLAVPVERLRAGLDRLASDPRVDSSRIAAVGFSKGAEAALLLASIDPRITAVVVASPTDRLWQGIDRRGGFPAASWSIEGQQLAYVPFATCDNCEELVELYRRSRETASPQIGRIAVEFIHGPILMLVSEADQVWPSHEMAKAIQTDLIARRARFEVAIVEYPEAGHFLLNGDTPAPDEAEGLAAFGGGTVAGLVAARQQTWPKVLQFLDRAFDNSPSGSTGPIDHAP